MNKLGTQRDVRLRQNRVAFFVVASAIAFVLHSIWEYIQCSPLFVHLKLSPTAGSMISATLGDVMILWASYFVAAAFKKSIFWGLSSLKVPEIMIFLLVSAIIAEGFEWWSIVHGRWTYAPINPTIFDVSVVPTMQMALLNPLTLALTRHQLRCGKYNKVGSN